MNSDPYDSAAWRTFGMLDSDESAIFDEAMRHDPLLRAAFHEMNRLGAAIAAGSVAQIPVRAGQLERLQIRLGLLSPVKRSPLWLGISGWAAAAVLALLLVLNHRQIATHSTAASTATPSPIKAPPSSSPAPGPAAVAQTAATPADGPAAAPTGTTETTTSATTAKAGAKAETKRLIQEIEVLRDDLAQYHERDRMLFDILPGRALPLVMTMLPPGENPEDALASANDETRSPLTAMLGDALATIARGTAAESAATSIDDAAAGDAATAEPEFPMPAGLTDGQPAAIPIYDAARDAGTLVVSNLPALDQGQAYHLWVTTSAADRPIYVGSLPESSASGSDTFDFSLGSSMVLPSGFVLTKDPPGNPAAPGETNTVLQGPPAPQP